MADDGSPVTDIDIVLMMMEQDEEGLRLLLQRYGGRLKGFLVKNYAGVLQPGELEEALNTAVFNIWRFADRYDEGKGLLASWCIRIAQRAAQSIIRREFGYRGKNLEYDPSYDPAGDPPDAREIESRDRSDDPRLKILHEAIEALPPLQKAIIQADLAAGGGLADAGRLAAIHGTTKNVIYVSRSKAREALRRHTEQYDRRVLSRRSSHGQRD
ncbi:MAG: sigma-70 family RNA polymerase sigma factor [Phycisphaerae bacterium]|nr:sigma-70 family RNA polymerase sigma factor [Phycisphaerae bacterium]